MKTLITFLFLLSICNLFALVFSQEEKLSVKLSLEKEVYDVEELMVVRLKYFNNDTVVHSIGYNCSLEDDIIWDILFVDEYGIPYKHEVSFVYDCASSPIKINPKDSFETYGAPVFLNRLAGFTMCSFLSVGKYKIYYSGHGNSDTLKFKIISNNNNDSRWRLYEIRQIKDSCERFHKWREFLRDRRNADFSNYAFDELISLRKYYDEDRDLINRDLLHFFSIEPNSWAIDVYLFFTSYYIKRNQGEDRMYNFLENLVVKYPDTRVSFIAAKIIKDKKIPDYVY